MTRTEIEELRRCVEQMHVDAKERLRLAYVRQESAEKIEAARLETAALALSAIALQARFEGVPVVRTGLRETCGRCGASLQDGQAFCGACGYRMKREEEQTE